MTLEFQGNVADLVGKFGLECKFPLLNLAPLCTDDVVKNLVTAVARWEDDTPQPMIIDYNSQVDVLTPEDECEPATLTSEIATCTVILPNQELVSLQKPRELYTAALNKFCRANGIRDGVSPFNADGTLKPENPLSERFLIYQMAELRRGLMQYLINIIWNGNSANPFEVDGILTQLRNGWATGNQDGGCDMFRANIIDWAEVTAAAGDTAPPEATIDAAFDTIVLNGHSFSGLEGLNLVEFLVLYMEAMDGYWFRSHGGVDQWAMFLPMGETNCIAELAACMQPCSTCPTNLLADPMIRERFADFRRSKTIELYPHNNPIPLMESPALKTASPEGFQTYIFAPWIIGGDVTMPLVFRDQDEEASILSGELPWYGTDLGLPDGDNDLVPTDDVDLATDIETRAFSMHLQRVKNCIEVWINTQFAIPVFAQHGFLVIDNVDCATLTPVCNDELSAALADCVDSGPNELTFTVAGLTVVATDVVRVTFTDGSVLHATVTSYVDPTLVLDFGLAIDCAYGEGALTVTPL